MAKQEIKLNKNLEELNSSLEKFNSHLRSFSRGLAFGLGSALGATLIAAALIGFISNTVTTLDDIPVVNTIVRELQIKELLEKME